METLKKTLTIKKLVTVKINQENVRTCSFMQNKILKIKESNKSTEASKMRFMRLVAAETLRNGRIGKDKSKL
jgi:hypothetical protein